MRKHEEKNQKIKRTNWNKGYSYVKNNKAIFFFLQ